MSITKEQIQETCDFLASKGFHKADVGIVLGTGLGAFAEEIQNPISVEYTEIPHFPISTVEFHKGRMIIGTVEGKTVVAMQGRFHFYEGYTMQQITYPIYVMQHMGIGHLLVSNAAGALNTQFKKGDLMLIDDHINLLGDSPLAHANAGDFGDRFVDMIEPYSKSLLNLAAEEALEQGLNVDKGIYVAVKGPQLETKAEYKYLRMIGADAVGMSTVPEVIVANQLKIKTLALSVLTDECDPESLKPVDIPEILRVAKQAEPNLVKFFKGLLKRL